MLALGCSAPPKTLAPPPPAVAPPAAAFEPEPRPEAAPAAPAAPAPKLPESHRIRVGILHSLSGTWAAYETTLMNAARMAIHEINRGGGVLDRELEPLVMDPASNWPLFAEKARELLEKERAHVVFGGHTSVSRKAMLPAFEELQGLLFYPAQHEGEETSGSVFYTGSVPNQSVSVVADYLSRGRGRVVRRWLVIGTDHVVPRTQAKVLMHAWQAAGVAEDDRVAVFTPFGHTDYQHQVAELRKLVAGGPTAVISLLEAESAVAFQRELVAQKVSPRATPVAHFGLDERHVAKLGPVFAGALLARSYFSTIDHPKNGAFKRLFDEFRKSHDLHGDELILNDDVEATYVGLHLWKQAVEKAKSFDVDLVTRALAGLAFEAPSGFTVRVDATNHHLHKPYFVAEVGQNGGARVVWKTGALVSPSAPEIR